MNHSITKLLAFGLLLWLSAGCKTLEEKCLERFPTAEITEVRKDTITDTLILPDTWIEYVDTTLCPPGLTDTLEVIKTRTIQLPGDTIVQEYYCTDTVIVLRDEERIRYLEKQIPLEQAKAQEARKASRRQLWYLIGLGAVLAIVTALYIRKSFF